MNKLISMKCQDPLISNGFYESLYSLATHYAKLYKTDVQNSIIMRRLDTSPFVKHKCSNLDEAIRKCSPGDMLIYFEEVNSYCLFKDADEYQKTIDMLYQQKIYNVVPKLVIRENDQQYIVLIYLGAESGMIDACLHLNRRGYDCKPCTIPNIVEDGYGWKSAGNNYSKEVVITNTICGNIDVMLNESRKIIEKLPMGMFKCIEPMVSGNSIKYYYRTAKLGETGSESSNIITCNNLQINIAEKSRSATIDDEMIVNNMKKWLSKTKINYKSSTEIYGEFSEFMGAKIGRVKFANILSDMGYMKIDKYGTKRHNVYYKGNE